MAIENKLADKVFFSISNDSEEEVNKYYREYVNHIELLGDKVDNKLSVRVSSRYAVYRIKKSKELSWRREDENWNRSSKREFI